MKRCLTVLTVLTMVFAIGFLIGCDKDPNSPGPISGDGVSAIEMRITHEVVTGFDGELRSETITAIALNAYGVTVPNVRIEFAISNPAIYKGTIVKIDSVTNYEGKCEATFSVVIDTTTSVEILATAGTITARKTIQVEKIDDYIGSITVTAATNNLSVKPNQTATTQLTATVADLDGIGIPDILVYFKANPPDIGSVESDTGTTNSNGQVFKTFSSTGANIGECEITVSVGPHSDATLIEVILIDEPRTIQLFTSTPVLKVVPDENAQIEVTATITDQNGNGVPGTSIVYRITPAEGFDPFGSLTPVDTTDENGVATTIFNTLGGRGNVYVRADVITGVDQSSAPEGSSNSGKKAGIGVDGADSDLVLPDSLLLTIDLLTLGIKNLNIAVNPGYLLLPKDTIGTATVYGRVVDENMNGIPNLRVDFNCDFGTLANASLTDSTGLATAQYYVLPITDFPKNEQNEIDESIVDYIRAFIPGTHGKADTTSITVEKTAGDEGTINLTTDVDFIYADFGLTTANLQAVLKDANNQALAGREVIFTATHGTVNSPVVTDSMGVARAIFTDNGLPSTDEHGGVVPSLITTVYNPMSLAASLEITILERNPVESISLQAQEDELTAGSGDSTWVGAVCFLSNGSFAPEGTVVFFECDRGRFIEQSVPITGHNGTAINYFIADPVVGKAHLRAYVDNGDSLVYSNMEEINLVAGPPTRISLFSNPTELRTTEPTVFSTITATVRDTANNHVSAGYLVTFTATLGALDRLNASTEDDGTAAVKLRPGVSSGVSVVTATVNTPLGEIIGTTTVDIKAGEGNSIELGANPINIAVAGTGENSSSTLTASLYDPNHNLVEDAYWIIFEILFEPSYIDGGCHFRNRSQIDSAQTSNGRASITLNAGTVTGPKLLKASAYFNNRQDTVSVILSRVSVTAGSPAYIDVDFNEDGTNGEGGTWICEVSARVFDRYMNPVADSIPVVFSCDSVATVEAGFTGNESSGGVVTRGVAFAPLTYNSEDTFDTLTITAEVNSPEGVIHGERKAALPLQEGLMVLHVDPQNWMIDRDPDAVFTVWVELRDGHEVLINNAPILFFSSRGIYYWYDYRPGRTRFEMFDYLDEPPEPVRKFTGWNLPEHQEHREQPGQATVFLLGEEMDFFLDGVTPEVNVQIGAVVEGYDDVIADPVIVVITRHP